MINKLIEWLLNFYYCSCNYLKLCFILFLVLMVYNIIFWVDDIIIDENFMVMWLGLIYLIYINSEKIELIFINIDGLFIDKRRGKKSSNILWMKIAEILLKKGIKKKNNLLHNNVKQKRYSSTNDSKKKLQEDIGNNIKEFTKEDLIRQKKLESFLKTTFKHPSISDIGKTTILETDDNEFKGETEILMVFSSTKPDSVIIDDNIVNKSQVLFKEIDGKDAFMSEFQMICNVDSVKLQNDMYFEKNTKFKGEYTIEESNKFIKKNNELVAENKMKNYNMNNGEITNNAKKISEIEDNYSFKKKIDDSIEDGINNWKD